MGAAFSPLRRRSARFNERLTGRFAAAAALLFYLAVSLLVFGRGVLGSPSDTVIGDAGADKSFYMWSFVWWPHAVVHGRDPFAANVVWVPAGIDLSWFTAVPGASLLALPLTLSFGPVVAYNVLAWAAPALAAFTAFLLARWVTGKFWPALLGGYLFGFSAYEVSHTLGHLNLTLIFLVPVCGLLVLRRLAGELPRQRFVVYLAVALAGQFLFSTEIFMTLCLVGALVAVLAWWGFDARFRPRLRTTGVETIWAFLVMAILVSPYLLHAFWIAGSGAAPARSPLYEATDLANYVVPTRRQWLRPSVSGDFTDRFTATPVEHTAYLGPALLAIVILFAFQRRRSAINTVLPLAFVALVSASLGPRMRVDGHDLMTGPWIIAAKLPITKAALPSRLTMFIALIVGLICAAWLADGGRRPRLRWALALIGVAIILPNPSHRLWTSEVPRPDFFSTSSDERFLKRGEVALVLPYGGSGWSMLWQAESGMRYRMVGGYPPRGPTPYEIGWGELYLGFGSGHFPADARERFPRFLAEHDVTTIIVAPGTRWWTRELVKTLPIRPIQSRDVLVYRVQTRLG